MTGVEQHSVRLFVESKRGNRASVYTLSTRKGLRKQSKSTINRQQERVQKQMRTK